MLDTLHFVRGAVSEKDIVPVLSHFCIYKGRIQGSNGRIYIDAPCPELMFEVTVPADRFLRAIDACDGKPAIRFTDKGKMVVEKKPFRAMLPNQPSDVYPKGDPSTGKKQRCTHPHLLPLLSTLRPFISSDAERAWASTLLFDHDSQLILATANSMIAALKSPVFSSTVQLPVFCVEELLRINVEPDSYIIDEVSITFFWGDRWLRSQLIQGEWPIETAKKWLVSKVKMQPIPKDLAKSVERIVPFCNDPKFPIVHFSDKGIATAPGEVQAEVTGFKLDPCSMHADNLVLMLRRSTHMGVIERAAVFKGDGGFQGVLSLMVTK